MWTKVTKPNSQTYTTVSPVGKERYDDGSVSYDSPTNYYDAIIVDQWIDVIKSPNLGALHWYEMNITWASANVAWSAVGSWNNVAKPI